MNSSYDHYSYPSSSSCAFEGPWGTGCLALLNPEPLGCAGNARPGQQRAQKFLSPLLPAPYQASGLHCFVKLGELPREKWKLRDRIKEMSNF